MAQVNPGPIATVGGVELSIVGAPTYDYSPSGAPVVRVRHVMRLRRDKVSIDVEDPRVARLLSAALAEFAGELT